MKTFHEWYEYHKDLYPYIYNYKGASIRHFDVGFIKKAWDYVVSQTEPMDECEKEVLVETLERYEIALRLVQSIFCGADFKVETPNESALLVAMEKAGFPIIKKSSWSKITTREPLEDYDKTVNWTLGLIGDVDALTTANSELEEKLELKNREIEIIKDTLQKIVDEEEYTYNPNLELIDTLNGFLED